MVGDSGTDPKIPQKARKYDLKLLYLAFYLKNIKSTLFGHAKFGEDYSYEHFLKKLLEDQPK